MSYESKEITVAKGKTIDVNMQPSPIGSLVYWRLDNFSYTKESDYPNNVSDNTIRKLTIYSRNKAVGYKLNPKAVDKYIYKDALGTNSWNWLSDQLIPTSFNDDWTFFQLPYLYDFFYVLDPNPTICFGYILEGKDTFEKYGEHTYNITNGRIYLAYWDYFKVGNPYFGIADNNHWNTYGTPTSRAARTCPYVMPKKQFMMRK